MLFQSQTSGDILLDRRFAYAAAMREAGDHAGAADLLAQIVDAAPHWVAAWMALGAAAENNGNNAEALRAFGEADRRDAQGAFGASLHVARLTGRRIAPVVPPAYVAALFDDYASRFEEHLLGALDYRGPTVIVEALREAGAPLHFDHALDLGCGTGLMGRAIRDRVTRLDGVDLSPAMVAEARRGGAYDTLVVGNVDTALAATPAGTLDLVLAADVFVYLGVLDGVFAAASRALAPGGILAFTVQSGEAGVRLGDDMRVTHAPDYLRGALAAAGLAVTWMAPRSTRADRGQPVPGLVVVARKP